MAFWILGNPCSGVRSLHLLARLGDHQRELHNFQMRLASTAGLVLLFGVGLLLGYIAAERVTCF